VNVILTEVFVVEFRKDRDEDAQVPEVRVQQLLVSLLRDYVSLKGFDNSQESVVCAGRKIFFKKCYN
jgi:hypothetical protein